jgi:hypothetical protein
MNTTPPGSKGYIPSKKDIEQLITESIGELAEETATRVAHRDIIEKKNASSKRLWALGAIGAILVAANLTAYFYLVSTQERVISQAEAATEFEKLFENDSKEFSEYAKFLTEVGRTVKASPQVLADASEKLRSGLPVEMAPHAILPKQHEFRIEGNSVLWYSRGD